MFSLHFPVLRHHPATAVRLLYQLTAIFALEWAHYCPHMLVFVIDRNFLASSSTW